MNKSFFALLAAGALLLPATAGAQAEGSYRKLVREGLSEFDAGNWVEAYNLFKSAHEVSPNARTQRGMGATSYELKEYPRALEELRAALEDKRKRLTPRQRTEVLNLIERAERLVGTLEVTSTPPQAQVFINDRRATETTVVVPVGETSIRAQLTGYKPAVELVTVNGGQMYPVHLELVPVQQVTHVAAPAAAPEPAPNPALTASDEAPRDGDGGVLASPWLWIGVGVAVAAGVTAGLLLSAESEEFPDGNVGLSARALEAK